MYTDHAEACKRGRAFFHSRLTSTSRPSSFALAWCRRVVRRHAASTTCVACRVGHEARASLAQPLICRSECVPRAALPSVATAESGVRLRLPISRAPRTGSMKTGARSPREITHCFVLKGFPLAWSMLQGVRCPASGKLEKSKDIENRRSRLAAGWYGVILGKGAATRECYDECKKRMLGMDMPPWNWAELHKYQGCVVGVVKIAHSLPYAACKESPWAMEDRVCNVIEYAGWLQRPIPCKGNLGACPIPDETTRRDVREYADAAWHQGEILATGAERRFPCRGPEVWRRGSARRPRERETNSVDDDTTSGTEKRQRRAGDIRSFLAKRDCA